MSQRTAVFSKRVRDSASPAPVMVAPATALKSVVDAMVAHKASAALVIDQRGCPLGILTEQDITRRLIFRMDPATPVAEAMSSPVISISDGEYLYYAIAQMRRAGLRHMGVVDGQGKAIGLLTLAHTIAQASGQLMTEIDQLTRDDTLTGQAELKQAQVSLADHLLSEAIPTPEIQGLLTRINNDIYRRLVDKNLKAMAAEGLGPPPAAFSVIVMGSGGRGENYLYPDQDNGFIIDDYPDPNHTDFDRWFIDLAERLTADLDAVGLPLCRGYVMATNPLWRKTLSQWKHQLRLWNTNPTTTRLRLCDIFFDFRTVWGSPERADDLRRYVTKITSHNPAFLRAMYDDDQDHGTALGWLGRFITVKQKEDPAYQGYLNLKHTATLPLVEAIRLLALREGLVQIGTLDRLQALYATGILNTNTYDYLHGAFCFISHLLFRQQLQNFKSNKPVNYYIHPDSLTKRETDILKDSLKAIDDLRDRIRGELTGDLF